MSAPRHENGQLIPGYSIRRDQPSFRTPENAQFICEEIIAGRKLKHIATELGMKSHATILMWVASDPEFEAVFRRAKAASADALAEEILEIADDTSGDIDARTGRFGTPYEFPNKEFISRSRVRIDVRFRLMAAYAPHRYGQKVEVEHDVSDAFAERLVRARARVEALSSPVIIDNEEPE